MRRRAQARAQPAGRAADIESHWPHFAVGLVRVFSWWLCVTGSNFVSILYIAVPLMLYSGEWASAKLNSFRRISEQQFKLEELNSSSSCIQYDKLNA